ncbi:MAG: DNRLRE domain-containing protein [Planctomycetia bacterium]|nr:DNRLRE domain-containing protein [Planctomycetia bacterium]
MNCWKTYVQSTDDWTVYINGANWGVYHGGSFRNDTVTPVLFDRWQHVAVTFDPATGVKFYLNGELKFSSANIGFDSSTNPLILGRFEPTAANYFEGNLDEVRVWKGPRTQAEIQANMSRTVSPSSANLIGYFPFDEGSGNAVVNQASTGGQALFAAATAAQLPSWSTATIVNGTPVVTGTSTPLLHDVLTATQLGTLTTLDLNSRSVASLDGLDRAVNLVNLDLSLTTTTTQTATPISDTFITEHGGLGGATSTHGADTLVWLIGQSSFRSTPQFRFDLTPYAGRTVTGDVTFALYLPASNTNGFSQVVELREATVTWDSSTTFTNISGGGPTGSINSTILDQRTVAYNGTPNYVQFTLPKSVIQSWIDNPASNRGLVLKTQSISGNDLKFESREAANPPKLTFTTAAVSLLDNNDLSELTPRRETVGSAAGELVGTPQLESLDLTGNNRVTDVSTLTTLPNLTSLKLEGTGVSPVGAATLTTLGQLSQLTTLTMPNSVLPLGTNLVINEGSAINVGGSLASLDFDGVNDFVDLGSASVTPLGSLTSNFTVTAWIKPDVVTGLHRIISRDNSSGSGGWSFEQNGSQLRFTTIGFSNFSTTNANLQAGQWTHVAATVKSGGLVEFFVNGASIGNVSGTLGSTTTTKFVLGAASSAGTEGFDGRLNDVGVWSGSLTSTQLDAVRRSDLPSVGSNPIGFWKLNEGTGTTVASSGPTAINGTLTNGPTWGSDVSFTGPLTLTGSFGLTTAENGIATVTVHGGSFPLVIRNVAPTITAVPNLGTANGNTGLNEGQTITVVNGSSAGRFDVQVNGVTTDTLIVTDPSSVDLNAADVRLTITNPDGSLTDLIQRARRFADDRVAINSTALDGANSVTTTFWLKTTKTGPQTVMSAARSATETDEYEIRLDDSMTLTVGYRDQQFVSFTTPNLADGTYHHVAVIRDAAAGSISVLVDGVAAAFKHAGFTDDFHHGMLDTSKWTSPRAVAVTNGGAVFSDRDYLNTVQGFNLANGTVRITGSVTFGSDTDLFQVLTRSNGTPTGAFFETQSGLELFVNAVNDTISIGTRAGGVFTSLTSGTLSANLGDTFTFVITDNGSMMTATVTEVGGDGSTATISANSTLNTGSNLVTIHNREGGNTSTLNNVTITQALATQPTLVLPELDVASNGLFVGQHQTSLGGGFVVSSSLVGQVDDLTVWHRALNATEVAQIRTGKINASDPSLRLWLPFNEAGGSIVKDRSSYALDGVVASSYQAAVLASSPLAYYPLNEVSGTQATDASGNAQHGTYSGPVVLGQFAANNQLGTAPKFLNGNPDTSVIVPSLGTRSQVTVEAWVNPASYDGLDALYLADNAFGGNLHVQFSGTGALRVTVSSDANFGSATTFPLNQWTHVVAMLDAIADTITVYANGVSLGTQAVTMASINLPAARVGAWSDPSAVITREFDGRIDEFAIYGRALSADEARQHYICCL